MMIPGSPGRPDLSSPRKNASADTFRETPILRSYVGTKVYVHVRTGEKRMKSKAKSEICPFYERIRKRLSLTIDPDHYEYIKKDGFNASRFFDNAIYALRSNTQRANILITTGTTSDHEKKAGLKGFEPLAYGLRVLKPLDLESENNLIPNSSYIREYIQFKPLCDLPYLLWHLGDRSLLPAPHCIHL